MAGALHMLGAASGTGLKSQVIAVQINRIDEAQLKRTLAENGKSVAIAPLAVFATDSVPKAVLDLALPIAAKKLEDYGVYATLTTAAAPTPRAPSEFFPGALVGVGAASLVFGVGWATWKLLLGRIF